MQRPRHLGRNILLIGSGLTGLAILAWTIGPLGEGGPEQSSKAGASQPIGASEDVELEFAMPPSSRYAAIIERPIFEPSRRPTGEATITTGEAPAIDMTLAGVVLAPSQRLALLRRGNSSTINRVREGEVIAGWTVVAIESDAVVLRQSRRTLRVGLAGGPEAGGKEISAEEARMPWLSEEPRLDYARDDDIITQETTGRSRHRLAFRDDRRPGRQRRRTLKGMAKAADRRGGRSGFAQRGLRRPVGRFK
jgi:hypothetical protein